MHMAPKCYTPFKQLHYCTTFVAWTFTEVK
jgi:hypothetical protein